MTLIVLVSMLTTIIMSMTVTARGKTPISASGTRDSFEICAMRLENRVENRLNQ